MLPRVIIHNMMSLDARVAGFEVDMGLYYELAARFDEDAMLCGSETILAMEHELPDGSSDAEPPQAGDQRAHRRLVIIDSRGRVSKWAALLDQPYWSRVIAACSETTPAGFLSTLSALGIEQVIAGQDRVDLRALLEQLNSRYRVETVRVDSGGTLNALLLRAGLVDEVSLLVAPHFVGGSAATVFNAPDPITLAALVDLRLTHAEQVKDDVVWLRYEVVK